MPDDGFEAFRKKREGASNAFANGNGQPLIDFSSRKTGTFFDPRGLVVTGANEVIAAYDASAKLFESGGWHYETLQFEASQDLILWVYKQLGEVTLHGQSERIPFNLRVTEAFRLEDGDWKLIHRHADRLPA